MKTEFFVKYDLYDTTALQDAEETSQSNSQGIGNLALLKEDVSAPNYGTLEHNFFVLDGSMEEFPDEPDDLAYFSSGQSNAAGTFDAGFNSRPRTGGIRKNIQFFLLYLCRISKILFNNIDQLPTMIHSTSIQSYIKQYFLREPPAIIQMIPVRANSPNQIRT